MRISLGINEVTEYLGKKLEINVAGVYMAYLGRLAIYKV
jgi:hypothetical protein